MRIPAQTLAAVVSLLSIVSTAHADNRLFTFSYEATTMPRGQWEYEQWVTWKTAKETDRDFDRFDFRHELEFGLTDSFQLGLYVSDWRYEEGVGGNWRDVAVEGIFNLTNPVTDPVGLALYGEVKVGEEFVELEGRFIAQKSWSRFTLVYNATIEAEWEGDSIEEDKGSLEQTAGFSFQFSPRFSMGMELLHEVEIPDWQGVRGKGRFYLGPNFAYRAERWWATLTPLFQVSDVEDEPDFQMRLIVGIHL